MRRVGHETCRREIRNAYKILIGKSEGSNHVEDLGIDGKIRLDWILGR
jgi:hypothetical protein